MWSAQIYRPKCWETSLFHSIIFGLQSIIPGCSLDDISIFIRSSICLTDFIVSWMIFTLHLLSHVIYISWVQKTTYGCHGHLCTCGFCQQKYLLKCSFYSTNPCVRVLIQWVLTFTLPFCRFHLIRLTLLYGKNLLYVLQYYLYYCRKWNFDVAYTVALTIIGIWQRGNKNF